MNTTMMHEVGPLNDFTPKQRAILAIIPKIMSIPSLLGSLWIVFEVLIDQRKRKITPYHRIMVGLSVADIIFSLWLFVGTWAVPKGTPGVAYATGNEMSCDVQGFLIQFGGSASTLYNASLALYFLLVIRYNLSEKKVAKVEKWIHFVTLGFSLATAIVCEAMNLYHASITWCWIAPDPDEDCFAYEDFHECLHRDNSWLYRYAFRYIPIYLSVFGAVVCMILVYLKVRRTEERISAYEPRGSSGSSDHSSNAKSRKVRAQAMWYVLAFFLTYIPFLANRIEEQISGSTHFPLKVIGMLLLPSQGMLNVLVYLRPRYCRLTTQHPEWSRWQTVKMTVLWPSRREKVVSASGLRNQGSLESTKRHKRGSQLRCYSANDAVATTMADNGLVPPMNEPIVRNEDCGEAQEIFQQCEEAGERSESPENATSDTQDANIV